MGLRDVGSITTNMGYIGRPHVSDTLVVSVMESSPSIPHRGIYMGDGGPHIERGSCAHIHTKDTILEGAPLSPLYHTYPGYGRFQYGNGYGQPWAHLSSMLPIPYMVHPYIPSIGV